MNISVPSKEVYFLISEFVRQWLLIGKVDNDIIELWVSTSNTCTAAVLPSRQKLGETMFHVEGGNGYLYLWIGL